MMSSVLVRPSSHVSCIKHFVAWLCPACRYVKALNTYYVRKPEIMCIVRLVWANPTVRLPREHFRPYPPSIGMTACYNIAWTNTFGCIVCIHYNVMFSILPITQAQSSISAHTTNAIRVLTGKSPSVELTHTRTNTHHSHRNTSLR